MVEMPPASIPGFFKSVETIAADMVANGVTADELTRARNPRIAGIRRSQLTNEYWLSALTDAQSDPRRLDLVRTTFSDYESLTPADIQAAARRWFQPASAWKLVVRARPDVPAPPASSPAK
jgi:zinc protease